MKSEINMRDIMACAQATPTEETRYYLCGVQIEVTPNQTLAIATNLHILLAARHKLAKGQDSNTLLGSWILPTESLKRIKLSKWIDVATLTKGEGVDLILEYGGERHLIKPIDGSFPNWRAVFPRYAATAEEKAKEKGSFFYASQYLAAARKAHEIRSGEKYKANGEPFTLTQNGGAPARLHYDADFCGLLMPYRCAQSENSAPAWVWEIDESANEEKAA